YEPGDKASTVIGTPYFMPKEQFEGKVRDGRTDIYSLGVTFYYILTLKRPFDGKTPAQVLLNILKEEPTHPRELNPDVPEGIWSIIKKMMAREVEDRYSTCEDLLRDLKGYSEAAHAEETVFCPSCGFRSTSGRSSAATAGRTSPPRGRSPPS
ncbi:MAG: serine/threonine protein kinase, partial [Planctomycetota bacterium]